MNELPKAYNPKEVEDGIYQQWEKSGYFNPDNLPGERKEVFVDNVPPVNVTGVLHLGHALEHSIMDVVIRFQRMRGKKALLVPGTDHAAVATQARVEKNLVASGKYKNPREELGREKLLEIIREFAGQSQSTVLSQIRKVGTSCDWSRLAYTFDEQRSRAVNELFIRMYRDGLIYRGLRVVNWSVKGQCTCSDDELEYVERSTTLYTFKYSNDFPISIATTRPETKLGDTAVAVHPDDARYKQFIGKTFTVDVGAKEPLMIKIIADRTVDPNFGTGALGVTPAHSPIDYEMYEQRKGTPQEIGFVSVIGSDGKMAEAAGKMYRGLPVETAREEFVSWLRTNGLIEKEETIIQNVGTSDRFGDVIESLPMEQWFVDVHKEIQNRGKTLKDLMHEAVIIGHGGDPKQKITITPERFHDSYLHWIDHLRDWCISRQIWWGHRIPVWYCKNAVSGIRYQVSGNQNPNTKYGIRNTGNLCSHPIVTTKKIVQCPNCGSEVEQDSDTLDTWFSSGAWTFSTLGWPEQTKDLAQYHPTTFIQMGYEILFPWMARMILMSTYALDQIPFHTAYMHGLLRDEQGRKFSKSLGNGIDPIEMIDKYSADALRLSLLVGNTPGLDSRFSEKKVEHYKHFINKLWNITRLIIGNTEMEEIETIPEPITLADKHIVSGLNALIASTTEHLEQYRFSQAAEALYEFTWHEFADWYLEIAKVQMQDEELKETTQRIVAHCLMTLLKLWHPFIPFVTEHIYQITRHESRDTNHDLLMIQSWPKAGEFEMSEFEEKTYQIVKSLISSIRNFRSERGIEAKEILPVRIVSKEYQMVMSEHKGVIERLSRVTLVEATKETKSQIVENAFEVYIDLPTAVEPIKDQVVERNNLKKYVTSLESKLSNKEFLNKAPGNIVEAEQKKLEEAKQKLAKLSA